VCARAFLSAHVRVYVGTCVLGGEYVCVRVCVCVSVFRWGGGGDDLVGACACTYMCKCVGRYVIA
jgi:hypothetical protein